MFLTGEKNIVQELDVIPNYGEFVIAIRKDLGYSKTELRPENFLKLILKESKEEIKDLISKNTH